MPGVFGDPEAALAAFGAFAPFLRDLPDAITLHDRKGRLVAANPVALELLGAPWADIEGRSIFEVIDPRDREVVTARLDSDADASVVDVPVHRVRRADGSTIWVEVRIRPRADGTVLAVLRDVTDRVRAERALADSERRHRMLVEAAPLGILILTRRGIVLANAAMGAILGRDPQALVGRPPVEALELVHPDDRGTVEARVGRLLTGEARGPASYDFRVLRPGGKVRHLEVHVSVVEADGQRAIQALALDVTRRVEAQRQLVRAQKLEAAGRLAGGIAHDFNNLLTVVLNEAEALRDCAEMRGALRASVDAIQDATRRASRLTRQLLSFARKEVRRRQPVPVDEAIEALAPLLRRMVGARVRVVTDLRAGDAAVFADPSELEQVLVNLVLNARDAMDAGTVEIATFVRGEGGDRVGIRVADDGPGMAPEVAARCFEPFFTTRSDDGGTGLGLATCYAIVDDLLGRIDVASEPGRGTTFEIDLPRYDPVEADGPGAEAGRPRTPRLLLVEDDTSVRRALAAALGQAGFVVHEAASAEVAVGVWDDQGPFDALVTDVMLPGENGLALARRLAARAPGTVVVLVSGFADDEALRQAIEASPFAFFAKPFLARDLVDHLRARIPVAPAANAV